MQRGTMMAVVDRLRPENPITGCGAFSKAGARTAELAKTLFWIVVAVVTSLLIGQLS